MSSGKRSTDTRGVNTNKSSRGDKSPRFEQAAEGRKEEEGDRVKYQEREQIYRDLWHSDVKKDHGADTYDATIVQSLLPGHFPAPKTTIAKDVLFSSIVSDFQRWPAIDSSGICTVSCIGADYEYEVFPLHIEGDVGSLETLSKKINKFLEHLHIVKITDTTVHGAELLPYLENVKQAHTRETEYDPVGKMNPNSVTSDKKEEFKNKFYIEIGGGGINPDGLQYLPYDDTSKGTISELYSNKDIILQNKGIKNKNTGTLNVVFDYRNDDGTRTTVPEDGNIARVLEKAEDFLKGLFGIATPSTKRKEIVFLSKHFGDIGQVLTRYRDISLTPFKNINSAKINRESDIRTCNYSLAFESFDLNAISKAFLVGTEVIWYYPPADSTSVDQAGKKINYDRMIIFKRQRNLSIQEKIEKLTTKLGVQLQSLQEQIDTFHIQAQKLNKRKETFDTKWEEYIQSNGIGRSSSSSSSSSSSAVHQASPNINDRQNAYTNILQGSLQFAYFSNFVSKEPIEQITIKDVENSMELLYENLRQLALRFREIQYLYTEIFDGANLKKVTLEREVIIACSSHVGDKIRLEKKPGITDCWSRINFKDDGKTKGTIYEGRVIAGSTYLASWAFELVIHIYNTLSNYNVEYANIFLRMLHNVLNTDEQKIFEDLVLLFIRNDDVQGNMSGGARFYSSIVHKQKGGNPITDNIEILATILDDILHYFTFIHDILQGKGNYAKYIQKYLEVNNNEAMIKEDKLLPLSSDDEFRIDFDKLLSKDGFLSTFSIFPIYKDLLDTIENNSLIPTSSKSILVEIRQKLHEIYEYDTVDLTDIGKPLQPVQIVQAVESAEAASGLAGESHSEAEGNRSNLGSVAAAAPVSGVPFGSPQSQVATLAQQFGSPHSVRSNQSGSVPGSAAQADKGRQVSEDSSIRRQLQLQGGYRNAKTYKNKKRTKNESAKRRKSM